MITDRTPTAPTFNRTKACPALAVLNGTMGRDSKRRPLYPSHQIEAGRCVHCYCGSRA